MSLILYVYVYESYNMHCLCRGENKNLLILDIRL